MMEKKIERKSKHDRSDYFDKFVTLDVRVSYTIPKESIAMAKMSNTSFKKYIRKQLNSEFNKELTKQFKKNGI